VKIIRTTKYNLNNFLSWPISISSVGRISFPQLAGFYFLSWLNFISSVGRILNIFPLLAVDETILIILET
ncbi:MAG: hypothetical protein ACI3Y0_04015, partial [Prevotella sp.]